MTSVYLCGINNYQEREVLLLDSLVFKIAFAAGASTQTLLLNYSAPDLLADWGGYHPQSPHRGGVWDERDRSIIFSS